MTDPDGFVFIASNLAIFIGYVFLAAIVVPRATVRMARTRIGGIVFFFTCGLTHLEQVVHYLWESDTGWGVIATEWHMLVVHVVQAVAVWLFVSGLYLEAVRWGPWRAGRVDDDGVDAEDVEF